MWMCHAILLHKRRFTPRVLRNNQSNQNSFPVLLQFFGLATKGTERCVYTHRWGKLILYTYVGQEISWQLAACLKTSQSVCMKATFVSYTDTVFLFWFTVKPAAWALRHGWACHPLVGPTEDLRNSCIHIHPLYRNHHSHHNHRQLSLMYNRGPNIRAQTDDRIGTTRQQSNQYGRSLLL